MLGADLTAHEFELFQAAEFWSQGDVDATVHAEDSVDDVATYTLDIRLHVADRSYDTFRVSFGQEDLVLRKLELLDASGTVRRSVVQSDIRMVGPIPVAHRLELQTPRDGSHTRIDVLEIAFDALSAPQAEALPLERGRCR